MPRLPRYVTDELGIPGYLDCPFEPQLYGVPIHLFTGSAGIVSQYASSAGLLQCRLFPKLFGFNLSDNNIFRR